MKCNKCGYDLKEDNEYCPNCGTKVELVDDKVECLHCHYRMEQGSNFCPKCGKGVIIDNSKCKYCGYALEEDNQFCPNCGKERKQEEKGLESTRTTEGVATTQEPKKANGYIPIGKTVPIVETVVKEAKEEYVLTKNTKSTIKEEDSSIWKNPILWIVSISLLIICILLSQYMEDNPSKKRSTTDTPKIEEKVPDEDLVDLKIEGDTSLAVAQANSNAGGTSYIFKDKLYLGYNSAIYEMNLDFSKSKKIVDEYGEYIYVDNEYIYYCDEDNTYIRVNRETKQEEELLQSVYYPQIIEGVVYYQADSDGETIHAFNLETKEDKKLNNERSYNIIINSVGQCIYYTTANNDLYQINLDGTNPVLVKEGTDGYIYDGNQTIYYIGTSGLSKIDIVTKEDTVLYSNGAGNFISLLGEQLVYGGYYQGVYVIDKDGKNKQTITTNSIANLEVQGNLVIYTDVRKNAIYGANKKTERTLIEKIEEANGYYKDEDYDLPDIKGVEDF